MNDPEVYFIGGHGSDALKYAAQPLPKGVILVVKAHATQRTSLEPSLLKHFCELPIEVLANPLAHKAELVETFGSLAFYSEGMKYPVFSYQMLSVYDDADTKLICRSSEPAGIIDLRGVNVSPTCRNTFTKDRYISEVLSDWAAYSDIVAHIASLYKYSIFPVSTEISKLLLDPEVKETIINHESYKGQPISNKFDCICRYLIDQPYISIDQSTLLNTLHKPAIYYNFVCRDSTNATLYTKGSYKKDSKGRNVSIPVNPFTRISDIPNEATRAAVKDRISEAVLQRRNAIRDWNTKFGKRPVPVVTRNENKVKIIKNQSSPSLQNELLYENWSKDEVTRLLLRYRNNLTLLEKNQLLTKAIQNNKLNWIQPLLEIGADFTVAYYHTFTMPVRSIFGYSLVDSAIVEYMRDLHDLRETGYTRLSSFIRSDDTIHLKNMLKQIKMLDSHSRYKILNSHPSGQESLLLEAFNANKPIVVKLLIEAGARNTIKVNRTTLGFNMRQALKNANSTIPTRNLRTLTTPETVKKMRNNTFRVRKWVELPPGIKGWIPMPTNASATHDDLLLLTRLYGNSTDSEAPKSVEITANADAIRSGKITFTVVKPIYAKLISRTNDNIHKYEISRDPPLYIYTSYPDHTNTPAPLPNTPVPLPNSPIEMPAEPLVSPDKPKKAGGNRTRKYRK